MKKMIVFSSLFVLVLSAAQSARADACNGVSAAQNLVSNCGFETGSFTGWTGTATTAGVNTAGVDTGDVYALPNLTPYNGTYEAYLGAISSTITLTQNLTTVAGMQYTIKFAVLNDTAPSTGYTNTFDALFGANDIFSQAAIAAGPYTLYTVYTTATSSSTNLSFTTRNDGGSFELDSVSVIAGTPEPSSVILLGTGLLGLAGTIRRRFRS